MKAFAAAVAALLACTAPALAQAPTEDAAPAAAPATASKPAQPISYFFGVFQGETKVVSGAGAETEASGRLSRVETSPVEGGGFTISWSTLYIDEANPSVLKVKDSTDVTFGATPDPKVFRQATPDKLWTGKPYYWARIDGNTLHISALVLDENGTYDVIHYARTIEGDTQRVEFTRFKDGNLERQVTGTLARTKE